MILLIDEVHTLVGSGSVGRGGSAGAGLDIANLLKPALARGELQVTYLMLSFDERSFTRVFGDFELKYRCLRLLICFSWSCMISASGQRHWMNIASTLRKTKLWHVASSQSWYWSLHRYSYHTFPPTHFDLKVKSDLKT